MVSQTRCLPNASILCLSLASSLIFATEGSAASSSCAPFDIYEHPNASNFYPISAVVQETGASSGTLSSDFLVHSNDKTWQIANILTQGMDSSGNSTFEVLDNYIYLNESLGQNASTLGSILSGCSIIFNLPESGSSQTSSSTGDCTSLVGSACVNDITVQIQRQVSSFANDDAVRPQSGCESIMQSLASLPNSCPGSKSRPDPKFHASYSQGLDMSYQLRDHCSRAQPNFPLILYQQTVEFQRGNFTTYDQWTRTPTIMLLTFFSNASTFHGSPFADTRLMCTSPTNIAPGSHNPNTSVANVFSKASRKLVFVVGFAMNTLVFFLL